MVTTRGKKTSPKAAADTAASNSSTSAAASTSSSKGRSRAGSKSTTAKAQPKPPSLHKGRAPSYAAMKVEAGDEHHPMSYERGEEIPITWFAAITTYFGYAVLIMFGHIRDFFGRYITFFISLIHPACPS